MQTIPGTYHDLYSVMPSFIKEFANSMVSRRQPLTLFNYLIDYRLFLEWILHTGRTDAKYIKEISIEDLSVLEFLDFQEFFGQLVEGYESHRNTTKENHKIAKSKPNGPGLRRKVSSLTSLFHYLYALREMIPRNELTKFKGYYKNSAKDSTRIEKYLREPEVKRLFDAVYDLSGLKGPYLKMAQRDMLRNWAILVTFIDTGIRVSTLCALNRRDIDFKTAEATYRLKGGKQKRLPVRESVLQAISSYLKDPHRPQSKNGDSELALFISSQGTRLSISAVQYMVKKYIFKAGLDFDLSTHSLRHTFGTNFYNVTGDINLTADFLCHTDPSTTARFYAGIKDSTRRMALKKLPPLPTI
ncbi:putative Tyrosine recombinase XerC [Candidatus Desulfosporosinus infrequens]|uniref:Putative Tyrosine recombinase XerC n=1 Tax=Candidatus Desulfosporosinus infrequens TaxID=2043169 RepID=A0A2U3LFD4_9FIRM|nr:putative Tyrosine recombinase XerC [Candidatus Desulfosporosinus infrequens]